MGGASRHFEEYVASISTSIQYSVKGAPRVDPEFQYNSVLTIECRFGARNIGHTPMIFGLWAYNEKSGACGRWWSRPMERYGAKKVSRNG